MDKVINMILACSSLKKSFQGTDLLKDITFKIEKHDKLAIIGVNGAGKTTLLRIICGEESYDSGTTNVLSSTFRLYYG